MKNTIIFLGVAITAIITWFAYALLASIITYTPFRDCLSDDTVIAFLFSTGWILPCLVGYDLYRYTSRHKKKRKKRNDREVREIRANTFSPDFEDIPTDLLRQLHLN